MSQPTQTCQACGLVEVVRPDGRGFPPDIAKRRLAKRCAALGHISDPTYRAGLSPDLEAALGPIGLGPGRCASTYVTGSSAGWTDVVQCSKPPGHKSKEHLFTTRPKQGPGETYRWTDEEAR